MPKQSTMCADNDFYKARIAAASCNDRLASREGASEETGIDRTRLARIELEQITPYPEEVMLMADTYDAPQLTNYYCSKVCPLGKKTVPPAEIFVCSMADLFGAWAPDEWIRRVFEACEAAPWHNYLFLTKNPQRLCDIANAGWLPKHENWWYGTSVTKKGDRFFGGRISDNIFISIEPLMGSLDADVGSFGAAKWIIVGAETGNRRGKVTPQREWIENIIDAAKITHAAVLLKDSKEMRAVWGDDLIQQFPQTLTHGKEDGK